MALLKKINVDNEYAFEYIQKESYQCKPYRKYTEKTLANSKIKRKYVDYESVEIQLYLALLTTENIDDIYENLKDGTYEYDDKGVMKRANFVVDLDPLKIRDSGSKFRYKNFKVVLEKSSNYEDGEII